MSVKIVKERNESNTGTWITFDDKYSVFVEDKDMDQFIRQLGGIPKCDLCNIVNSRRINNG